MDPATKLRHLIPTLARKKRGQGWVTRTVLFAQAGKIRLDILPIFNSHKL